MSSFTMRSRPLPGKPPRQSRRAPTTEPGFTNSHGQVVQAATGAASTSMTGQRIYRLRCTPWGREYGSNGCDIHERLCPHCQKGAPGEPLREANQPSLFAALENETLSKG